TVCADVRCKTLRGRIDGTLESVAVALPVLGVAPKRISLSVEVGSRTVLTARASKGFHVWTKHSRCPHCKRGNVFVSVDRKGHFADWDGDF
ncbi:MAG: hypothetical protein QOI44_1195, partial [Actinomycetota bacterium]|nr:hypothetical protein [Actinomycetota bacterium]